MLKVCELVGVAVHVTPLLVEYLYDVISAPPVSPSETMTANAPSSGETESIVVADGVVAGTALVAALSTPLPCELIARILTR